MKSFFQEKTSSPRNQPAKTQATEEASNPPKKFDPLEVIKCLSEMKPITIIYGKEKRGGNAHTSAQN